MEALTAVSVACLTLFDMLKAIDRTMAIGGIEVTSKSGGKSGDWHQRMISFDEAIELIRSVAHAARDGNCSHRRSRRPGARAAGDRADRFAARDVSAMDGYAVREATSTPSRISAVVGRILRRQRLGRDGRARNLRPHFHRSAGPGRRRPRRHPGKCPARAADIAIIDERSGHAIGTFAGAVRISLRGTNCCPRAGARSPRADRRRGARTSARSKCFASRALHILSTGDELAEPGTRASGQMQFPKACRSASLRSPSNGAPNASARRACATTLPRWSRRQRPRSRARTSSSSPAARRSARRISPRPCSSRLGCELIFSKVAIKPGKPVWLGTRAGQPRLGSAGKSDVGDGDGATAARAVARRHVRPADRDARCVGAGSRLPSALERCGARETFHRARWTATAVGDPAVSGLERAEGARRSRTAGPAAREFAGARRRRTEVEVLDF